MIHSNSSSTLLLIAVSDRDAYYWQNDHPELAETVRVVYVGTAVRGLLGIPVTAAYFTYEAERHRDAPEVEMQLKRRIAITAHPAGKAR